MPLAERNAKLEDQKKRMPGLHFGSEKEPIHKLVDTVCQMTLVKMDPQSPRGSLSWLATFRLGERCSGFDQPELV